MQGHLWKKHCPAWTDRHDQNWVTCKIVMMRTENDDIEILENHEPWCNNTIVDWRKSRYHTVVFSYVATWTDPFQSRLKVFWGYELHQPLEQLRFAYTLTNEPLSSLAFAATDDSSQTSNEVLIPIQFEWPKCHSPKYNLDQSIITLGASEDEGFWCTPLKSSFSSRQSVHLITATWGKYWMAMLVFIIKTISKLLTWKMHTNITVRVQVRTSIGAFSAPPCWV